MVPLHPPLSQEQEEHMGLLLIWWDAPSVRFWVSFPKRPWLMEESAGAHVVVEPLWGQHQEWGKPIAAGITHMGIWSRW